MNLFYHSYKCDIISL